MSQLTVQFPIVSTTWLADHLQAPSLRILDASWYLPQANRDPAAEYAAAHIPGAIPLNIDLVSDPSAALPHTLPSAAWFTGIMRLIGIHDGDPVVVYDGSGANLSAGRAWWLLRTFGHDNVAVLDGGMRAWTAAGLPTESGAWDLNVGPSAFTGVLRGDLVRTADDVATALAEGAQVVDMRSRERFEGTAPEPRPGVRGGHMPGSRNVPFTSLVRADGTLKQPGELRALLADAGVDPGKPIICSCGSGLSAGALALALATIGQPNAAIYDGSWSEWGADTARPVVTGPA